MKPPLFLPHGVYPNDVPDPEIITREFSDPLDVAQNTTGWQWKRGAFPDIAVMRKGAGIKMEGPCGCTARLQTLPGTAPILPNDVGANTSLWKIPYNKGLLVIDQDNAASGKMVVTWTSTEPELVWLQYSLQYIRRGTTVASWSAFFTTGRIPRLLLQMRLDGAPLYGTGPNCTPLDGQYRGAGLAVQAAALSADVLVPVAPGTHTFEVLAGQASALNSDGDTGEAEAYGDVGPTDGVCIGTRWGYVIRLPHSILMGA